MAEDGVEGMTEGVVPRWAEDDRCTVRTSEGFAGVLMEEDQ